MHYCFDDVATKPEGVMWQLCREIVRLLARMPDDPDVECWGLDCTWSGVSGFPTGRLKRNSGRPTCLGYDGYRQVCRGTQNADRALQKGCIPRKTHQVAGTSGVSVDQQSPARGPLAPLDKDVPPFPEWKGPYR